MVPNFAKHDNREQVEKVVPSKLLIRFFFEFVVKTLCAYQVEGSLRVRAGAARDSALWMRRKYGRPGPWWAPKSFRCRRQTRREPAKTRYWRKFPRHITKKYGREQSFGSLADKQPLGKRNAMSPIGRGDNAHKSTMRVRVNYYRGLLDIDFRLSGYVTHAVSTPH